MTLAIVKADVPLSLTVAAAEDNAQNVINQFSGWATALMRVVEDRKLFAIINGKKYLEFEAWQLIGSFDHAYVDTDDVAPVMRDGEIVGHVCHAKILKDGIRVGAATQMCGFDAFPCQGKQGSAKDNAAISAAQTWAGSKALKMRYSAVAILGGYGAATAEEMRPTAEADRTSHWCEDHQTNWFKRGRMKNYAHPIEGTDKWCNEPTPTASASPAPSTPHELPQDGATIDAESPAAPEPQTSAWPAQAAYCPIAPHGGKALMLVAGDPRPKHPIYIMVSGKQVMDRWCYGV